MKIDVWNSFFSGRMTQSESLVLKPMPKPRDDIPKEYFVNGLPYSKGKHIFSQSRDVLTICLCTTCSFVLYNNETVDPFLYYFQLHWETKVLYLLKTFFLNLNTNTNNT